MAGGCLGLHGKASWWGPKVWSYGVTRRERILRVGNWSNVVATRAVHGNGTLIEDDFIATGSVVTAPLFGSGSVPREVVQLIADL